MKVHVSRAGVLAIVVALMASKPAVRAQGAWQLDPTFGTAGTTRTNVVGGKDTANAMAVQSDGGIIVAGVVAATNQALGHFAVARYERRGRLDRDGFGDGGIRTAIFGNAFEVSEARAVFLQPDGKIVAAGTATLSETQAQEFAVARFLSNGALDPSFGEGGNGTVTTGFGTVQDFDVGDIASAIVIQPDGRIVVAGGGRVAIPNQPTIAKFNLARYHADGRLDESFGDNGRQVADFGDGDDFATAGLYISSTEQIVAVGTAVVNGTLRVALARFDRFGQPDVSFGLGGQVIVDRPINGATNAVLQPDGKILVTGTAAGDFAVLRLLSTGEPDTTFGTGGMVTTDFGGPADTAFDLVEQADGAIVVVGRASAAAGDANNDFGIARFTHDGVLDPTFDTIRTNIANTVDAALGVALQSDGKIVAAGIASEGDDESTQDIALARYAVGSAADLRIAQSASASTVNVGETFSYTLTLTNAGPDDASDVVIDDTLPAGTRMISCEAPPDGACSGSNDTRQIRYASLPGGATRTVTLVAAVDPAVPDGTTLENTAVVNAGTFDPDESSNSASASITVRNVPHTLRFFLHGTDVPGTAGGFTMNLTPTASQTLRLNLLEAPTWVSDPLLTGTAAAGSTFRVMRPCSIGLGVLVSYRLAKVDVNGGAEQPLGQVSGLLTLCTGQETVTFPVATPVTFNNERLRLTISSSVAATLTLQLGEGTFLEMTGFSGVP